MSEAPNADATIRFYYSFRSPYAWLAAEKLDAELGDLGVAVERLPVYPKPELFPNDPAALPAKQAYLVQDVPRLAREAGLTVTFPKSTDTDWATPHAAALGVERAQGAERGHALVVQIFRKRFSEGLDVGEDAVIAEAAECAGVPAGDALAAAHDAALREEVDDAWRVAQERDGLFGVPTFVFAGRMYWGQDRMRFLRGAVERRR